ncbi:hypothetical protein NQ317_002427, partial [Molorchus minor]
LLHTLQRTLKKNKVRRDIGKLQTQRAVQLCDQSGVVIPEEGCGIPELQHFQQHLKQYKIVPPSVVHIIVKNVIYLIILKTSTGVEVRVQHVNNRLHAPKKLKSLVLTVNVALEDKCVMTIIKARSMGTVRFVKKFADVNSAIKPCKAVDSIPMEERYCKICKSHVPSNHLCYIQPDTSAPQLDNLLFVFYDLETRQEKILEDGSLLHEPNLCVYKQCCDVCLNTDKKFCEKCGLRLQVVKFNDVISSFIHHLLTIRKKFKHVVVIAHNGQAFDHQFVLNYILTNTDLTPELIMRGTKIISMVVENVKFLDSLNYFPMALSKLPKAFGLDDNFKKGISIFLIPWKMKIMLVLFLMQNITALTR